MCSRHFSGMATSRAICFTEKGPVMPSILSHCSNVEHTLYEYHCRKSAHWGNLIPKSFASPLKNGLKNYYFLLKIILVGNYILYNLSPFLNSSTRYPPMSPVPPLVGREVEHSVPIGERVWTGRHSRGLAETIGWWDAKWPAENLCIA